MLTLPWLALGAAAADPNLTGCCTAVGATTCPEAITAVGPASAQAPGAEGTVITGLWTLSCGTGATWDPAAATTVSRSYPTGTVLTPMLPTVAACFEVACSLPTGACVHNDGKRTWLAACNGEELTDADWRAPARPGRPAVIVGNRVLGATIGSAPRPEPLPDASSAPPPVTASAAPVDPKLPALPPERCNTSPSLREPSNQQVDAGNEAVVAGNLSVAADRYRAAISINPCNAFAWAALGEVLANGAHPQEATTALTTATRLMPAHFHAWTVLGTVRASQGDVPGAVQAYQRALAAKPGHAPAAEGLARLGM